MTLSSTLTTICITNVPRSRIRTGGHTPAQVKLIGIVGCSVSDPMAKLSTGKTG
jgi:hypothetical protein